MRILLICPFFPPENKIASVRIAKFAEHWTRAGHEVRVLTRSAEGSDLAVPTHENLTVVRVADPAAKSVAALQSLKPLRPNRLQRLLSAAYAKSLALVWPDIYHRWARTARREAEKWNWRPDVVVASVGPFSTLLLGRALASRLGGKLVVDYRDLLTLSSYYPHGHLRKWIDGRFEKQVAEDSALLATVSTPLAEELSEQYGRPTLVVTNGYDPNDFADLQYDPEPEVLRIRYCGWVIPQRRDPRTFLQGVAEVLKTRPDARIAVDFYGPPSSEVIAISQELGIEQHVNIHGRVNHRESLSIQANSDVLLLLLWNNVGEAGVLSGKVFEYIGAGRPILMTGLESGAAAQLIRDHGLGLVSNNSSEIAAYLTSLAEEKARTGKVSGLALADEVSFTREAQSQRLLQAIERL